MNEAERSLLSLDLETVLRDIYDLAEVNVAIASFLWCGWTVKIGDEMNGFQAERTFEGEEFRFELIAMWLAREICGRYPQTEFAKKYNKIAPHFDREPGGTIMWVERGAGTDHIDPPFGIDKSRKKS
jgi:hypothetical protein